MTRPQQLGRIWRKSLFIKFVFIVLRHGQLSAMAVDRAAHFFAFIPRPAHRRTDGALCPRDLGRPIASVNRDFVTPFLILLGGFLSYP